MEQVISSDGTRIVFDRLGEGPALILVGGATCDRAITRSTAEALARSFTVINFDRRGRGSSGDTQPFGVEREIEDIGALIEAAGGRAAVYGHSSGAALVIRAAASGLPMTAVIVHDAPFRPDDERWGEAAREYGERLRGLLAEDRRGEALDLFMSLTGMPDELIAARRTSPGRASQEALAPTLAYDSAAMGDIERGASVPTDLLEQIDAPVLVLSGAVSPPFMVDGAVRIADGVPDGRHRVLEGQGHEADPEILAAAIAEFAAAPTRQVPRKPIEP
jgi:pimeloyl-ACP methyl ester carboxylesterase